MNQFVVPSLVWVLNVSPDSFSDGRDYSRDALRSRIHELIDAWVDLIDVWAESTAPWSLPIDIDEELSRLADFFSIIDEFSIPFSLDTTKVAVAHIAIDAGVRMINDVSWGRADWAMRWLIAQTWVLYVMMYCKNASWRADKQTVVYPDWIVHHVIQFFEEHIDLALSAGINRNQLILDPGMGAFVSHDPADSVTLLQALWSLRTTFWLPLYVCVSRKWFLRRLTSVADQWADQRVGSSLAASLYAMNQWVSYVRVHDVLYARQMVDVWKSLLCTE